MKDCFEFYTVCIRFASARLKNYSKMKDFRERMVV